MSLYDTLGVKPEADPGEIKSAYRKKAQESHPDRPQGDAEVFHAIQKAYDILGDQEKRKRYDETGDTDAPPSEEQLASQLIVDVFNMLLSQLDETKDFVKHAKDFIASEIAGVTHEAQKLKGSLVKIKRLSGRVKAKQQNLFQSLLDQKMLEVSQRIAAYEKRFEVCNVALKMLEDYKDDVSVSSPLPEWFNHGQP